MNQLNEREKKTDSVGEEVKFSFGRGKQIRL